jgi:ubiquinone/menaquinone biosynthesis C-methylase UbiE
MENLKQCLKRWPWAYKKIQRLYYRLLYFTETSLLGTRINEWAWKYFHKISLDELDKSAAHPHRGFLTERIAKHSPFNTVLEIGGNAGQNLLLLARKFPQVEFHGIDINHRFIAIGKNWLANKGVRNVSLRAGRADQMSYFGNRSFDIVFTDATLMYIGPDKIHRVLSEIKRMTGKAILMNEWHMERPNPADPSLWYDLHWVHDYRVLLQGLVAEDKISITKLPNGLWRGGGWEEYGSLVEVDVT